MAVNAMPKENLVTMTTAEPVVGMADTNTARHGSEGRSKRGHYFDRSPEVTDTGVMMRVKPDRRRTARVVADRDIARRAYELYMQRGGEDGHDLEDWLQAERELLSAPGSST